MRSALALLVCLLAGCVSSSPAHPAASSGNAGARTVAPESAPPNAVMLDYRSPEELARERSATPAREPASQPAVQPTTAEERPRIRQTIVIGRNNPEPVWEVDGEGPAGVEAPTPSAPRSFGADRGPTLYRGGYYFGGGRSGGGSQGSGGGRAAPRVGGDWPQVPSYGPTPMR